MDNYEGKFKEEWENYRSEHQILPNIMILGRTGVGKSSLINTIFKNHIAEVSDLIPETQDFKVFRGEEYGISVNLIDSKGYEINDDADESKKAMESFVHKIQEYIAQSHEKIHLIWYCIPITEERVEPLDKELIKRLSSIESIRGRIAVILTKCDEDDEDCTTAKAFKDVLNGLNIPGLQAFETSNVERIEADLDELIRWSIDSLDDEDLKDNFISAQQGSLKEKRKRAKKIINKSTLAAGALAISPLPNDAPGLIAIQMNMIVRIINIYGISGMAAISKNMVSEIVISSVGKSLAASLIKIVPIAGNLVNAAVAVGITKALGEAISEICSKAYKDSLAGKKVQWDSLFDASVVKPVVESYFRKGNSE